MPSFGRDPFMNDPFFADSGFGRMDQMMNNMRKQMKQMMNTDHMGSIGGGSGGNGHFVQQTFVSSTKMDANGRPIQEKYQNKVAGAIGNGNKVIERQQLYDNSATGLQKASHERMLNDKGRKVVRERIGDQMNSHDHYRNMREEESHQFDQQWGQMAGQLGLGTSTANNRLGYGGGSSHSSHAIQYDDDRRGAYVNPRSNQMPVNYNRQAGSDIGPTMPGGRVNAVARAPAQNNLQSGAPLALTDGGAGNYGQPSRAVPINRGVGNNYAIPRAQNKPSGPARAS